MPDILDDSRDVTVRLVVPPPPELLVFMLAPIFIGLGLTILPEGV